MDGFPFGLMLPVTSSSVVGRRLGPLMYVDEPPGKDLA